MLREDVVREVLARLARGEHVKTIARELGVDKKTIKRWRRRGAWRPRAPRVYAKAIDAHRAVPGAARARRSAGMGSSCCASSGRRASRAAISRCSGRCSRCGRRAAGRRGRPCALRRAPASRPRSISASCRCGLATWRRRSTSSSSRSASRDGRWPTPTATSGWTRCSMATSGRLRHFGGVPLELPLRQSAHDHAGPIGGPGAVASALRGLRAVLRLHAARLSAVSRADQGQGRERREIREAECAGGPPLSPLGRAGGVAGGMGGDRGRRARARHDARAPDRSLRARDADAAGRASRRITTTRPDGASSRRMPWWRSPPGATRSRCATSARPSTSAKPPRTTSSSPATRASRSTPRPAGTRS